MVEKWAAFAPTVGGSGCGKKSDAFLFFVNSYWQPLMEANDKARGDRLAVMLEGRRPFKDQ
jgi:hypothetical protein